MRVTSIQLEMKERTRDEALATVLELLDRARGSDLILLPELWTCGYFSFERYTAESESAGGTVISRLQEKAAQLRAHILTGSIIERDNGKHFNTAFLLSDQGQILAKYRKIHLFGHQSQERKLLTPGSQVAVAETKFGP